MRNLLMGAAAVALSTSAALASPDKDGHNPRQEPRNQAAASRGHGQADAREQRRAESAEQVAPIRPQGAHGADRASVARVHDGNTVTKPARAANERSTHNRQAVAEIDPPARGLINGCPPGLARKDNGCTPPGLARDDGGARTGRFVPAWFGYGTLGDGRYAYGDGYLYRLSDAGTVQGYVPLLGGALWAGQPWPAAYGSAPLPSYQVDYYNLGSGNSYRYADDVIYRVDPRTAAITAVAALMTGDRFAVGQRMPAGYDIYNVPYAYRDRYADRADASYRYADGYVYEIDPTTQVIRGAIELLT